MSNITAIIPMVAIPSHPSSEVVDQTIENIRSRLPDAEIILMFDGVPPQLMHLKGNYEKFTQEMLLKVNKMDGVTPLVFSEHHHQSLMTKKALEFVRTQLILWSEQDTPLHDHIPFGDIEPVLLTGYANVVRFHFEAQIHPEHQYLMLDQKPIEILGVPFLRTRQWSGRPHLATTKYYREIASKYWDDQPRFIEHVMYGVVVDGPYDEHRMHMYAPEGTLVRSLHTDGRRKGAEQYDPNPS